MNESHYLTKALALVRPDGFGRDLYLSSASAHWLFLQLAGRLADWTSLEAAAWIGRWCSWLLMGFAFHAFAAAAGLRNWLVPAALALMLVLVRSCNLAGEWVVGGFEAKTLAWPLVFLAWAGALRNRWWNVWVWCGAALALHFVVGWWALVTFVAVRLRMMAGEGRGLLTVREGSHSPFVVRVMRRFLAGTDAGRAGTLLLPVGAVLAGGAVGAVPAVWSDIGLPPETVDLAARIQVFERLRHHLWFGGFGVVRIASFTLLLLVWWRLARQAGWREPLRVIQLWVLATLGLDLCGLVLSAIAERGGHESGFAVRMLRLYWFRMADVAVPAGVAVAGCLMVQAWREGSGGVRAWIARAIVVLLSIVPLPEVWLHWSDRIAPADRTGIAREESDPLRIAAVAENWERVCGWIRENTPAGTLFLTPPGQQTFHWHAGRSEVAVWKHAPQNATDLIEWRRRMSLPGVVAPGSRRQAGFAGLGPDAQRALLDHLGVDYVVLWQREASLIPLPEWARRVFPERSGDRSTFEVWQFLRELPEE